jgi:predicted phosphodiesterase
MQTKNELCREYVKRFPTYPRLKLARIIYKENNLLFSSVDTVRSTLRYIAGKLGESNKKRVADKLMVETDNRPFNPYSLPESDETKFEPFIFSGHKRIAILSDIHVPYHSISSLTAAIEFCKKEKPDGLLLNGDTMDCHHLSRFIKDPKSRDFKLELDTFKALINVFEKQLKCKIYFKIGNHELRYQLFLQQKANELIGVEEFDFENIIKARARGITIIGDKQVMKLNELNGIHGHEYIGGISAPVNVARGLYLRGKVSAFQGHNHSTSEHSETDMNGKIVTTWSIGCLSELHPNYMPLNKWNHGMGIVDLDANGRDYQFRNKRIFKGKVL